MQAANCLNCGADVSEEQVYCGQCGQQTHQHRLTIAHFLHEFFHAFTHADKGIFFLLKELAIRPGTVAREYIGGKRKKYFNPFTFFLILMGIFVFSNSLFHPAIQHIDPDPQVLARIPTEAGRQHYIVMMERVGKAGTFMSKHGNILGMIAVPFLALILWLFFKRKPYNYAEHLTANLLFVTFSNLVFTVIIFPLQRLMGEGAVWLIFTGLFLQALYFAWAYYGFLQMHTTWQAIRSLAVCLLAVILWSMLSMTMMALYIYQSADFYRFFGRMFG